MSLIYERPEHLVGHPVGIYPLGWRSEIDSFGKERLVLDNPHWSEFPAAHAVLLIQDGWIIYAFDATSPATWSSLANDARLKGISEELLESLLD